jgi:hypothetical protein
MNLRFHIISSTGLFIVTFLIIWSFLGPRALPWWTDGGLWLKYANGLLGVTWPLWDEKPFNYPPLFTSILALLIRLTNDPLFSIKFLAAFLFSLRTVVAYLSSLLIFREKLSAIAAALIIMLLPIHVEMVGWGGYPNILGLSLLMISTGLLVSWLRGDLGRGMFPLLFITSALIPISHNLTFLVYSTFLTITMLLLLLARQSRNALRVLSVFLLTLAVYAFYVFVLLWPPSYLLYNEAAYHHLKVNLSSGFLTWIFKSVGFLLILYALTAVTIASAILLRKRLLEIGVLVSWLITPLFLLNLHIFGIALDYQRIFLFFVDPFILLASCSLQTLTATPTDTRAPAFTIIREHILLFYGPKLINLAKRLLHLILFAGLITSIILSSVYGFLTFKSVSEWYNFRDKYGDLEKLEALNWINDNTNGDSVFVAEEEIARWIEGYSSRRVLMNAHPMYLFVNGEHERAYAAKTILLSSLYLSNDIVAIYEPHDSRENVSTRIALKSMGALEEVFFLESNSSYFEANLDGNVIREYLSNARGIDVFEGKSEVRFSYIFENLRVDKVVLINSERNEIALIFKVESPNPRVKLERLVIELKGWPTRTIWEAKIKPNGTLSVTTDIGQFIVKTNAMTAFPFIFGPEQDAIIQISPLDAKPVRTEVKLIHSSELIKEFNARYVVIPRLQDSGFKRYITLHPTTRPEYMHLLKDPSYRIVYQNERVIILEFIG